MKIHFTDCSLKQYGEKQAFLQKLDKSEKETFELETANSLVVKKITKIKEKLLLIAIVIFTNTSKSFLCLNADK